MACCDDLITKCNEIVNIDYLKYFVSGTTIDVTTPSGENDAFCPSYGHLTDGSIAPFTDDSAADYYDVSDGIYVNPSPYSANPSNCCNAIARNGNVRTEDLSLSYFELTDFNPVFTSNNALCGAEGSYSGGYKITRYKKIINPSNCSAITSSSTMTYDITDHTTVDPDYTYTYGPNVCGNLEQSSPGSPVSCNKSAELRNFSIELTYNGETYSSQDSFYQEGMALNIEWFENPIDEIESIGTNGNVSIGLVSASENITIGNATVSGSPSSENLGATVQDGSILLNVGEYTGNDDRQILVSIPYTVCSSAFTASSVLFTQHGAPFVPSSASPECCEYTTSSLTSCDSQMYLCRYNDGTSNHMSNWAYIDAMRLKVAEEGYFNEQITYSGHEHYTGTTPSTTVVDSTQERLNQHMNKHAVVAVQSDEANATFHVYASRTETNENMFNGASELVEVTLPCEVTTINTMAFQGCSSLEKYNSINQIERIEDYGFDGCESLEQIGAGSNLRYIGNYAFRDCITPTAVTLDSHVDYVGDNAFEGCTSVKVADINADEIGDYAFEGCTSLEEINIYSNVQSIGDDVFTGCSSIKKLYYNSSVPVKDSAWGIIEEVEIGNNTSAIGDDAFYQYSTLTSVTMSYGMTSIGAAAFEGCGITDISIPNSVTEIGSGAFMYCENLTEVDMSTNITSIAEVTFSQCSSLSTINIPDGVEEIGTNAFADCTSLTDITIPDSVTIINRGAFKGCGLTSATIGSGITEILQEAFDSASLTDVYVWAETPPYLSGGAIPPDITIHVPSGSISAYQTEWVGYGYTFVAL